ncbi:hypothetical protein N185_22405 [Sinorhizobium sp. GW3]|nr:hypothetical protein N185_22405 [Sinorhizobium sp. GW3]
MDVAPAFEDQTLGVLTQEEIFLKLFVGDVGDVFRAGDMGVAGTAELELGTLFLAIGAVDQKHLEILSAQRRRQPLRR